MNFSLEIGPNTDLETVPPVSDVYITMLPGGDYRETAHKAIELVKKFPKQQFILDHIAKPNISYAVDELWRLNIIELSKNQNVSCKLSGLVTETNNYTFNDIDFYPYLDIIFQSFGPKRILFGSDWPVCLLAANYKKVYDLIFDYLDNHSTEIKTQIFGLNAIKIYNL